MGRVYGMQGAGKKRRLVLDPYQMSMKAEIYPDKGKEVKQLEVP